MIVPLQLQPTISIARQCALLEISRASWYYAPVIDAQDLAAMAAIDEIFTAHPFYGSRRIRVELEQGRGIRIGRDQVRRLMRTMGLEAIYPKQHRGSAPNVAHQKYPYLLQHLSLTTPNQVWGADITYIRCHHGFCYLVALIDWFSRYVVAWELSHTLQLDFCLKNLTRALAVATPEIHNSDQGSHFTSPAYTSLLADNNIRISLDGRGRCMDNIFTERLWRTVKYEEVYLKSYADLDDARRNLTAYFQFYNHERRHQSLAYRTPADVYGRTNDDHKSNKKTAYAVTELTPTIPSILSTITV